MMRVGTTIPFRSRGSLPPLAASPTAHGAITGKYRGHGITLAVEIRQGFQALEHSTALGQNRLAGGMKPP